ncbi:SCO1860 family LAETG-anchored protein [Streptomyces hyaluromycini]|uniref:SCO1860 family LAETG-anchored protein n=1 Tax=Streptomyces hyaluromycini TaxID=1377993 RepID=UPI000B5C40BC|nr:SCO1860 family LAETG-anchored protein [Streptomyces hyaluromycini]
MNSDTFRMPARRLATFATAAALAAGPAALAGAGTAHATTDHGRASAVVLRTGLRVSLLDKTVNVPLAVSLNEVRAPQSSDRTALTATLDGVDGGKPFHVLGADVAAARATVADGRAEASVHLAHARLHLPGLPLLSLVELDTVTSKAVCETGRRPEASANVLGAVTVLGKRVTLSAGGPTDVKVPGVGEVRLDLSKRETTSTSAAASALELKVSVNPLKLNVAEVEGTLTLAKATCETPPDPAAAQADPADPSDPTDPVSDVKVQGAPAKETKLAETGGSSVTPYVAGGALALMVAGGGVFLLVRRRSS